MLAGSDGHSKLFLFIIIFMFVDVMDREKERDGGKCEVTGFETRTRDSLASSKTGTKSIKVCSVIVS